MDGLIAAGIAAGSVLSLIALWRWIIPAVRVVIRFFKKVSVALDLFNGRGPTIDEVTGEKLAEVLPLPLALAEIRKTQAEQGHALAGQGEAISDLTSMLGQVADQHVTLVAHTTQLAAHTMKIGEHDAAIAALIAGTYALGSKDALSAAEKAPSRGPVVPGESEPS